MKTGDIVKIYEDPVTKQKLEGNAKVVKIIESEIYNDGILCHADVRFESEPKVIYQRQIFNE